MVHNAEDSAFFSQIMVTGTRISSYEESGNLFLCLDQN